jgi:predicted O-methyltransferase YrrM
MKLNRILRRLIYHSLFRGVRDGIEKYLNIVMSAEGQISRSEAAKLIELAKNTPPTTDIVEIGTYRGRSTIALAFGSLLGNSNRVYAIDPHVEFRGIFGGQFGPQDQAELYRNLLRARVGNIVAVVNLPSQAVAKSWSENNVGLLWVDGDHRYEAVRADYKAWYPFIRDDGVIAFHDSDAEGVKALINEITQSGAARYCGQLEMLSWFRKASNDS